MGIESNPEPSCYACGYLVRHGISILCYSIANCPTVAQKQFTCSGLHRSSLIMWWQCPLRQCHQHHQLCDTAAGRLATDIWQRQNDTTSRRSCERCRSTIAITTIPIVCSCCDLPTIDLILDLQHSAAAAGSAIGVQLLPKRTVSRTQRTRIDKALQMLLTQNRQANQTMVNVKAPLRHQKLLEDGSGKPH